MMLAKGHAMYYSNASCAGNMPMSCRIPRTVKQQQQQKTEQKASEWFECDINSPKTGKSISK